MFKRIFFSVDIPDEIREEIIFYKRELENDLSRGVKWVESENLHVTLLFLGEIKEYLIEELFGIVESVQEESFTVTIEKSSYFPRDKTRARLIWISVKSKGIEKLEKRINELISLKLQVKNERIYLPHITLGRIKQWDFRKLPSYKIPRLGENLNLNFKVTSFNICESKIKKEGPTYHILKSFNLVDGKK